jgi:hypothetical protein
MAWRFVGGPREYEGTATGGDIAVGWSWDIEQDGVRRTISAEISDSDRQGRFGFEDAEQAVLDVLEEADPPQRLVVTATGAVIRP